MFYSQCPKCHIVNTDNEDRTDIKCGDCGTPFVAMSEEQVSAYLAPEPTPDIPTAAGDGETILVIPSKRELELEAEVERLRSQLADASET